MIITRRGRRVMIMTRRGRRVMIMTRRGRRVTATLVTATLVTATLVTATPCDSNPCDSNPARWAQREARREMRITTTMMIETYETLIMKAAMMMRVVAMTMITSMALFGRQC